MLRGPLVSGFEKIVPNVLHLGLALFWTGPGKDPDQVRMRRLEHITTVPALTAGRVVALAPQHLSTPPPDTPGCPSVRQVTRPLDVR